MTSTCFKLQYVSCIWLFANVYRMCNAHPHFTNLESARATLVGDSACDSARSGRMADTGISDCGTRHMSVSATIS